MNIQNPPSTIAGGFFYIYLLNLKPLHIMEKIKTSKRFQLTGNETIDGFIFAMIVGALMVIQQSLDKEEFTFNWKAVGMAAVGAGITYLVRKFVNKPSVTVTTTTNEAAEKTAEQIKKKI